MNSKAITLFTAVVSSLFVASSALMAAELAPVSAKSAVTASAPILVAATPAGAAVQAAAMTPEQIVKTAGATLFPENFSAKLEMTAYKPGSAPSTSQMMLYKRGNSLVRADYLAPAVQAGQRMLRKEGQIWMFMPDTKRAIKLSPKQSFGGSEFNNNDLVRLNLEEDYIPTIASEDKDKWVLELKAKDRTVSYDMIKYTVEKKGMRSVKQEFYTLSGKLMKTLEFQEYKNFGGLERPSVFMMKSNLAEGVYTKMTYLEFSPGKTLPESEFRQEALNKQ